MLEVARAEVGTVEGPKCHGEAILDEASCRWNCTNLDYEPRL